MIPRNSLINNWKLNGNADDYMNRNNATWTGTTAYSSGLFGHDVAAFTAGSSSMIDTGSFIFNSSNDLSFTCWAYPITTGGGGYGKILSNGGFGANLTTSNRVNFSTAVSDNNAINYNKWNFIGGTFKGLGAALGGSGNIYVDGKLTGTPNQKMDNMSATTNMIIGNNAGSSRGFDGYIGDVRLYNKYLTGDEIWDIYQSSYPKQVSVDYPINQLPDLTDTTLKGAWLNKKTSAGNDYSIYRNNGTPYNITFDKDAGATFNGTSSYIDCGTGVADILDDITITGWFKHDTFTGYKTIVDRREPTAPGGYLVQLQGSDAAKPSQLRWLVYTDGVSDLDLYSTTTVLDNKWHHFMCKYSASGKYGSIVLDGVQAAYYYSANLGAITTAATRQVYIGTQQGASQYVNGKLKDIRIYNAYKIDGFETNLYNDGVPDTSLVLSTLGINIIDQSKNKATITISGAYNTVSTGINIVNGSINWTSGAMNTYSYYYKLGTLWNNYVNSSGLYYLNAGSVSSIPYTINYNGVNGVSGNIADIKLYTGQKSASWIKEYYERTRGYY